MSRSNPRIEEVDDDEIADDPEEMDLDAFDFARPQGKSLGTAQDFDNDEDQQGSIMNSQAMQAMLAGQGAGAGGSQMPQMPQMSNKEKERRMREQQELVKNYQCIYPVYFDETRSRDEGRRVSKADAVPNPLATEIMEALGHIANTLSVPLRIGYEDKTHPKDWARPGRVKVQIKKDGKPISSKINNSKCHDTPAGKYG